MNWIKLAGIAMILAGLSLAAGVYLGDKLGYSRADTEFSKRVAEKERKIRALQADLQHEIEIHAETTQQLATANGENIDAVNTLEAKHRDNKRLNDMVKSCLAERNEAVAATYDLVDLSHIAGVYQSAVAACGGLSDSSRAYLVPIELQQSPSQSVAEGIRRLVKDRCDIAIKYNGLYADYQTTVSRLRQ